MDDNVKCYAEHFDDVNGKCVLGRWVPTGGRLVPKAPETPAKDAAGGNTK